MPRSNLISVDPIFTAHSNIIWAIHNSCINNKVVIVDPGYFQPVDKYIQQHQLELDGILITHRHHDHINAVADLVKQYNCPVYANQHLPFDWISHPINDGDSIELKSIEAQFEVIATPGHLPDHLCYYGHQLVLSGDTLFAGGCGRVFEGTYGQLYYSLRKLAELPAETAVYCAHDYTIDNLTFGALIEPSNQQLVSKLSFLKINEDQITLPSSIIEERNTNVFLRVEQPDVVDTINRYAGKIINDPIDRFGYLRQLKDNYPNTMLSQSVAAQL